MSAAASLRARVTARVGRMVVDVALDTAPGTLVLCGPNGAGKTSLLSLVLGVLRPDEGRVAVGDTVLFDDAARVDVPLEHRRLGYVPQDYGLFPHLTVRQNVAFALGSAPSELDRAARVRRVDVALGELGLEAYADRRPRTLSGGERQRVALARALSVRPRALLLDEPLAALDVHARREVRDFLAGYLERLALPTIVVTHDAVDARELGHRIAVLEAGTITQTGTWEELAQHPASRFVEELVADGLRVRATPGAP
ncbi:MAG: ABC transporter ATP-binding protein, partial [Polyangiaceae bacterium]|nr:ABC transporter ATP-binding protein [Polyangiaceae bacterium]